MVPPPTKAPLGPLASFGATVGTVVSVGLLACLILGLPVFFVVHLAHSGPAVYPIVVFMIAGPVLGVARFDAAVAARRLRHPPPDAARLGAAATLWAFLVGLAAAAPLLAPSLVYRRFMRAHRAPDAIDHYFNSGFSKEVVGGAVAGLVIVVIALVLGSIWRWRQARLVQELPTSKARSVAVGPVELQGVARTPRGEPGGRHLIWPGEACPMQFDLEDGTGRIRVDARGARVRRPWHLFDPRVCEVVLTPLLPNDRTWTQSLKDGDPVYVLGYAESNKDAPSSALDSGALVVRPRLEPAPYGPLRYLFGATPKVLLRDFQHVFFVSNTGEEAARRHILRGIGQLWTAGLGCCALLAFVVWLEWPYAAGHYPQWPMDLVAVYAPDEVKADLLFPRVFDPDPFVREEALRWVTRQRPEGFQWQGKYYVPRTSALRRYAEPLLALSRKDPALRRPLLRLLKGIATGQEVFAEVCYEFLLLDGISRDERQYFEMNLAFFIRYLDLAEEKARFLVAYPKIWIRQSLAEVLGEASQHPGGRWAPWQKELLERLGDDPEPKVAEAARRSRPTRLR